MQRFFLQKSGSWKGYYQMIEKVFETHCGNIHYFISKKADMEKKTLVFLPGLTADHRLFDKQTVYFNDKYNVFVWDAPGHASSWPFTFDFSLMDKARWLDAILERVLGSADGDIRGAHTGHHPCGKRRNQII